MRTIFVTVDPAFPPVSGAELRAWQNVKAASELGQVLLLSFGRPKPHSPPPGIAVGHIRGMHPADIWRSDFDVTYPNETLADFRAIAESFKPDVVVLESLPLANLVGTVKVRTRALVIDLHNVESDLAAQAVQIASDSRTRCELQTRVRRIRETESQAAAAADTIWVCSSQDRERLIENGLNVKPIHVVPNGIPRGDSVQAWPPRDNYRREPILLFLGHLAYPPNVEGALALFELMPLVWKRIPGARLILAGRNPHPAIARRSQAGRIDLIGNPSSVAPLLSNANFAVLPLQRGGGTRIKALEAIAWGLPLVATARAVEGLSLENGIHVTIAETSHEFASAICDLAENPDRYESQRIAARRHVLNKFGPDAIRASVHEGLRLALDA